MRYDVRNEVTGETYVRDTDAAVKALLDEWLTARPEDDGFIDARFTIIEIPPERVGAGRPRAASSFLS